MRPAQEMICRVIMSFPCLKSKMRDYDFANFDAEKLWQQSAPWSHGERLCLQFCLGVYSGNPKDEPWNGFDLLEFVGMADSGHKAALIGWIIKPVWP